MLKIDDKFVANLKPDLSGKSFNVVQEPLKAGNHFDVQYNIQNTGTAFAAPSTAKFYVSTNDFVSKSDRYLGSANVGYISPNRNTGTLTKRLRLPGLGDSFWASKKKGTYTIGMIVDANDSVMESNEGNNKNVGMFKDKDDVLIDPTKKVTVKIDRARGDLDGWLNDSDFYSKVTIDGKTFTSGTIKGKNDIRPKDWSFSKTTLKRHIPIAIQLWDSDGGLTGKDDHADIDPIKGRRDVNLWYDAVTGVISGDLNGTRGNQIYSSGGGDSNRAEIWFKVS